MKFILLLAILMMTINVSFSQVITPPENKLSEPELANKSVSEVWLLKNSIYAKHGKPFKTYELHAFFMKQNWYKPNDKYSKPDFSDVDLYNIDLLNSQEKLLREKGFADIADTKQVNLDNIYNIFQYPEFNNFEQEKLNNNGFLVVPTERNQLFHIYENNDYLGVPSFISVDVVLQMYHLYFDMTLRNLEEEYLSKKLEILVDQLINELKLQQKKTNDQKIKTAIDFNLAYLSVSQYFIKGKAVPIEGEFQSLALKEIKRCKAHIGWDSSELFQRKHDYSQYIPRGHYTRSVKLKQYFLAMMWLGNAGIELKSDSQILSSIILSDILFNKTYKKQPLIQLWKDIYEPTVFYVGLSDDTGPIEIKKAVDEFFPSIQTLDDYDKPEKLTLLKNSLSPEHISGHGIWGEQEKQFRLMGQRFIPDSYIFHRLTNMDRPMPNSLDVMAGFGNEKAYELMMNDYKESWGKFPAYPDTLKLIIDGNRKRTEEDWKQNLYYHWLYNLKALFEIKNKNELPFFMSTDAWETKTLSTALASWAELRHNTVLYSKESVAAECGGDDKKIKVWVPEPPKGYVEPNVEFYDKMLSLMNFTISGLEARDMLDNRVKHIGTEFIDLLSFLKVVSEKENRKESLTLEEYKQIQKMGSLLDNLTLRVLSGDAIDWWSVEGPDKNMPVISDVHTANDKALEVGVGQAQEIYVIVEIEGKLKLTRGAVLSFYEFPWASSDRLTDDKWQEMLKNGTAPAQPNWINYKSNESKEKPLTPLFKPTTSSIPESSTEPGWKIIYYDTGC